MIRLVYRCSQFSDKGFRTFISPSASSDEEIEWLDQCRIDCEKGKVRPDSIGVVLRLKQDDDKAKGRGLSEALIICGINCAKLSRKEKVDLSETLQQLLYEQAPILRAKTREVERLSAAELVVNETLEQWSKDLKLSEHHKCRKNYPVVKSKAVWWKWAAAAGFLALLYTSPRFPWFNLEGGKNSEPDSIEVVIEGDDKKKHIESKLPDINEQKKEEQLRKFYKGCISTNKEDIEFTKEQKQEAKEIVRLHELSIVISRGLDNAYLRTTDPGSAIRRLIDSNTSTMKAVCDRRRQLDKIQQQLKGIIDLIDGVDLESYMAELSEDSGLRLISLFVELKNRKLILEQGLTNGVSLPSAVPYYDAADVALIKIALPELYFTLGDVFSVESGLKFKQADKLDRYIEGTLPDIIEEYLDSKRRFTDSFAGKPQDKVKPILQIHELLLPFITCEAKGNKCRSQMNIFPK